jgi:hypothetical protein
MSQRQRSVSRRTRDPTLSEAGLQRVAEARAAAMRLCGTARRTQPLGRWGLDRHRAQRWAAVWTVVQTRQAWPQDQSDLETALANGEFDHLLRAGERE